MSTRIGTAIKSKRILRNLQNDINFCTDIAEPTAIFDLLEFRWFRDWFRRSAKSVGPFPIVKKVIQFTCRTLKLILKSISSAPSNYPSLQVTRNQIFYNVRLLGSLESEFYIL